jgi:ribosomal protein S18 acetylase RimI-like enzyme
VPPRSLGFRTDLMIRRLAGSTIIDRDSYLCIRTPDNPQFWWGNFLLIPEPPAAGQPWEQTFAAEFPEARHRAIGVDNTDGDTGDAATLTALDLTPDVGVVLTAAKLAEAAPPQPSTVVRPLVSDADWTQSHVLRLACEEGEDDTPEHQQFLRRRLEETRRMADAGHGAWFGAFVDGQMRAGLGLYSDGSGYARFQSVDTHPYYRRQGLARLLLATAARWGLDRFDQPTFVIVADPDYFAIDLYRSVGFRDAEFAVQLHREVKSADQTDHSHQTDQVD